MTMTTVRIFSVDDSSVIRGILRRVIDVSDGCELVGSAATIAEARVPIAALRPDVVTLDIAMPDFDGLQYLDELNQTRHPAIVVVSASTKPGAPETIRALAHGADACFDKSRLVTDAAGFIRTLREAIAIQAAAGTARRQGA